MLRIEKGSLAPLLNVRNAAAAVEFYKAGLGALEVMRVTAPDGAIVARLSISECDLWLAEESTEHLNSSPQSLNGSSVRLILTVDDPDALYNQALQAGATVIWPVEDKSYGWRVGRLADPYGHHWEIGKPLR